MMRADTWRLAAAAALATASLMVGLARTDLWPPDEGRVAEISREMLADGSWVVPRLNGRPFLEEPPAFYWLQAATYRLGGGPSAGTARVPAALGAIAGVLATAVLARAVGADGLLAAAILATAPEYWWMARSATPDTAETAATTLALTLFFLAWRSERRRLLLGAGVAAVVAFGFKSFLGIGLGALVAVTFIARAGWGRLRRLDLGVAAAMVSAAVLAWLVAITREVGGGAATFFVVTNHFGRLAGAETAGHLRPFYYYFANVALGMFPWALVLPLGVAAAWRHAARPERLFPLVWAGIMLLALTLSASKRANYLLPAYPAFAVLVAQWWHEPPSERDVLPGALTIGVAAIAALVVLGVLAVDPTAVMTLAETGKRDTAAWATLVQTALTGAPLSAWLAAGGTALVGLAAYGAARSGKLRRAAAGLVVCLTSVHLVVVLRVLPGFNRYCTVRPWGQRLARLADRGVDVVLFRFDDTGGGLNTLLFYAGRNFTEMSNVRDVAAALRAPHTCAILRLQDYPALAPLVSGLRVAHGKAGVMPIVLVLGEKVAL